MADQYYKKPSTSAAFNKLPIELNKTIAHFLETDKDIASFLCICIATRDAILGDSLSFWRAKFREQFAYEEKRSNNYFKNAYQERREVLRRGTGINFTHGSSQGERIVLRILRELINESFQGAAQFDGNGYPTCPNLAQIRSFIINSKLFFRSKRASNSQKAKHPEDARNLAAVKLMLSHFLLGSSITPDVWAFDECQWAVYQPTNKAQIFEGDGKSQVNMPWLLSCLDFFRNYMNKPEAGGLYAALRKLDASDKPSPWRGPLVQGSHPLGKYWRSTFANLDPQELGAFRRNKDPTNEWADLYVDEGRMQTLTLSSLASSDLPWPRVFEDRLQSHRPTIPKDSSPSPPPKPATRAQSSRSKDLPAAPLVDLKPADSQPLPLRITGDGVDDDGPFFASGWLQPLLPQCGIVGWQRITFMKHFDQEEIDGDELWAYEGVVLPGGRLILGRWWCATEQPDFDADNCGPFIMWAVDGDPELGSEAGDED